MREGGFERQRKGEKLWTPANGSIVRLKEGFATSEEGYAFFRAGVHELREEKLYKVLGVVQDETRRGLRIQEVKVVTVAGKRHETPVGPEINFTPSIDFFEQVRYKENP